MQCTGSLEHTQPSVTASLRWGGANPHCWTHTADSWLRRRSWSWQCAGARTYHSPAQPRRRGQQVAYSCNV